MDGDKVSGRDFATGCWEADASGNGIVLRIMDDHDDEEERDPLAVVVLSCDDLFEMILAAEIAAEKRTPSQTS